MSKLLVVVLALILLTYVLFSVFVDAKADQPFNSCIEAKAQSRSNIPKGDKQYNAQLDKDHDGLVCE